MAGKTTNISHTVTNVNAANITVIQCLDTNPGYIPLRREKKIEFIHDCVSLLRYIQTCLLTRNIARECPHPHST